MNATMRESLAAVALIRRPLDRQTAWLAQWNPRWRRYHFAGGHRHDNETFHDCLVRELSEELELVPADFTLASPSFLEFIAWSESAREETLYRMAAFPVELLGPAVWRRVLADPRNRLLTEAEILAGRTNQAEPVSATMRSILEKLGLVLDCPSVHF